MRGLKSFFRSLVVIAIVFILSGCYRIRYKVTEPSPRGTLYTDQRWNNYFLYGFVPSTEEFEYRELCPSGELKELRSFRSPGNVLASVLSLGLSSSSTLEASCLQK